MNIHVDHQGKRLVGPMSLKMALEMAEEREGMRLAASCPTGDYVSVQNKRGKILIRKGNSKHGDGASELNSGEWRGIDDHHPSLWRPF